MGLFGKPDPRPAQEPAIAPPPAAAPKPALKGTVLGEKTHAFIWTDGKPLTAAEIRAFCFERLSDYKVPDQVTLTSGPLARNANGKVLKNVLRELARA